MEVLKIKQDFKGQSKLTDEQFLIRQSNPGNNLKTAKEVKHLIEVLF